MFASTMWGFIHTNVSHMPTHAFPHEHEQWVSDNSCSSSTSPLNSTIESIYTHRVQKVLSICNSIKNCLAALHYRCTNCAAGQTAPGLHLHWSWEQWASHLALAATSIGPLATSIAHGAQKLD